jgi:spore coat protein CotH
MKQKHLIPVLALLTLSTALPLFAQNAPPFGPDGSSDRPREDRPGFGGLPPFGPGGPGPGGPGGPMQQKVKLVEKFDRDGDKRLNFEERRAAREFLKKEQAEGRGRRRFGPPGGFGRGGEDEEPVKPGPKVAPTDVKTFPNATFYDGKTVRTFFLEFEDADWEKELAEFKNSDVDVPAKLTVDGKVYPDVGVHFRGMSSFMMVSEGRKRSLNIDLAFVHKDQQIGGYHKLDLLNAHEDPTFLRSVLSYQIERDYIPAPKANFARIVINGESWGIYANAQPFDKEFIKENFGSTKGSRWKVSGSPRGQGSLKYLGEDSAPYKKIYEIKSKDDAKSWGDLIRLCKVLNETPPDKLEETLSPLLDIDGALKFLALEIALVNNDGYWIRTSDYSIYEDIKGRFHIVPHDSNETFLRPESPGGPGGRRGPGGRGPGPGGPGFGRSLNVKGVELDPLYAANDAEKPLISKLLAVPALRQRYLGYVHDIAEKWLDWKKLGPIANEYHTLIADDVRSDTRKLYSTDAFLKGINEDIVGREGPGSGNAIGLKNFADQRRAFLLKSSPDKPASNPQ